MTVRIRYKPNHKEFGAMLMSDQTQDLADQGARRGVVAARALAGSLGLPAEYIASIKATKGPVVTMQGNPRRTARIEAKYPWLEFGSGRKRPRPQGGRSPHYRVLGRILTEVGNPPRGGGGPT